jgi:hypothetical protein
MNLIDSRTQIRYIIKTNKLYIQKESEVLRK